jgi:hypothetical protein
MQLIAKHCERWETFKDLIMLVMTTTEVFYGNTDAKDVAREVELAAKKSPLNMRRHHHHIKQQTCIGYSCAFEYFNVFRNLLSRFINVFLRCSAVLDWH